MKTVVINIVGLTPALIGDDTLRIKTFKERGGSACLTPPFPAVTCTSQATFLTGAMPSEHGIVGNGWYFRDEGEVKFWRQSNRLIKCEKIWERVKKSRPDFTCASICWWYNMHTTVDYLVTPRPIYKADGRKIPDSYTVPAGLRDKLKASIGDFPLFKFWGPLTSIESSKWIARSSMVAEVEYSPDLTFIYLPHLDYNLQRNGPSSPLIRRDLREIDEVVGELIDFYTERGAAVVLLSEYGITEVDTPVHLNRVLRQEGLFRVRVEDGLEILDTFESRAFAVADHQVAHIYLSDISLKERVRELLSKVAGVAEVLDTEGKVERAIDNERSGDLVCVAEKGAWFTYYYWLDDALAPDFARTVDIHRKPGYDPVELFMANNGPLSKAVMAAKLLKKKAGFRTLMDFIPLDATLVKGSHGLLPERPEEGPCLITSHPDLLGKDFLAPTDIHGVLLNHIDK